jgi:hypothetical protein
MWDGNYVIASKHDRPWRKQLNLLMGYLYFYNPVWLLGALLRRKSKVGMKPAGMQVVGMIGLSQSIRRTIGWAVRLAFGKIDRFQKPPANPIPMRNAEGADADHDPFEPSPAPASVVRRLRLPVATG